MKRAADRPRPAEAATADRRPPAPERDSGDMVGTRIEVEVGPPGHGGFCVARHEGRAVFVRHALPGERVVAEVTEGSAKDSFWRADAVEVLEASEDRVEPPCEYAGPGRCGGCDWQHAAYEAQLRIKGEVVAEQLRRLAKVDREVVVEEVASPFGWRTRVQFAVDPDGKLGFRKHRSHEVVPVEECAIASSGVDEVGALQRNWPRVDMVEVIAATGSTDRALVVTPKRGEQMPFVDADVKASVLRGVSRHTHISGVQRIHGRPYVREVAEGRTWRVSGSGFWQVHPAAPDVLTEAVLDFLNPKEGDVALDLYCGVGLFAAPLAEGVGESGAVMAVELDRQAVRDAAHNLGFVDDQEESSEFPWLDLVEGSVDEVLADENYVPDHADIVVLDPPRAGAGRDVCDRIAALRPRAVVYVACDPASLARDVAYFAEAGYELTDLRAFDLFPMTRHVECVALLRPAQR
ncbi:tRNA/tmRNA/rRNA uracil-C5-methylase (TrmA/RlmC/RlmD family) [Catenulispora sp. MAP12-49]|uniref:class I SAM-dependent RNA methyltransferase n=1 Tax=Catenulispora sp. MAP12-49 TaxID=3156302 RepID=UPI003512892A